MGDAVHTHNLRSIMESIHDLASTVSSLQLASGRRNTGGQQHPERPKDIRSQLPGMRDK